MAAIELLLYVFLTALVGSVYGDFETFKRGLNDSAERANQLTAERRVEIEHESDRFWHRFLKESFSLQPTKTPSRQTTRPKTKQPTTEQSRPPTKQPTKQTGPPTKQPITKQSPPPTKQPTAKKTPFPTKQPTAKQTRQPTKQPAVQPTNSPGQARGTVADVVIRELDLAILEEALQVGLLLSGLVGNSGLTLFAPTDGAFEETDLEYVSRLLEPQWILHLRNLLLFHVSDSGVFSSETLTEGATVALMNGESADITVVTRDTDRSRDIFIDESLVSTADIFATNGIVHKIDTVRFPAFYGITLLDFLDRTPELSILAEFVRIANLEEEATGFQAMTLFAPSNAAFAKLPVETLVSLRDPVNVDLLRNVLLYHLVDDVKPLVGTSFGFFELEAFSLASLFGPLLQVSFSDDGIVTLNQNTKVETADILVWNGIIHRVDAVLRPPVAAPVSIPSLAPKSISPFNETPRPTTVVTVAPAFTSTSAPSPTQTTILDLVLADPDLSELSRAVVAAQIANTFDVSGGLFTLFAPINNAFQTLPADDLAKFFTPPWRLHLQALLLFHASVNLFDVIDGTSLEMLNGETITVSVATSGAISLSSRFTNDAFVTESKATATNGDVYKIDSLLLPSFIGLDIFDVLEETDNLSTLSELIGLAGLEESLRTGNFTVLAPVNAAFDALEDTELAFLRDPANKNQLRDILLYHVVDRLLPASQLSSGISVLTVVGPTVNITIDGDGTILNGRARVLRVDRLAFNGIIHSIGSVLIPPVSSASLSESPQAGEKKGVVKKLVTRVGKLIPGL